MAAGRNAMRRDAPARTWARLTLAGAVAYLIMDVIAQALPPPYGPIRQAESNLGVVPFGWVMDANFILRGLLTGCALLALRRGMPRSAGGTAGLALVAFVCAAAGILALSRAAPFPGALPAAWPQWWR
ncbi:DUF998 domain-containing protein [Arthrobacter sp. SDTb3-6]|uniref:DUF998 domain-containing protein n=1 Tax=Arthrobacter sp. SDTb3-6 TaxID=2713571 RepID=UPI00159E3898|nr:DUF998 domain-containing protein [Arthrobacter sp. SDTb3-6]NVM97723.1 DUF998 domain-containing protein [Arthrobacter sp. SDTb3-6]